MTQHKDVNLNTFALHISVIVLESYKVLFFSETEISSYLQKVDQINYSLPTFELWKVIG